METYVLTTMTYQSRALFVLTKNAALLVKTLLHYRDQGWFQLHGFAVMPDQLHVLLTPGPNQTIESCAQCIKSGFVQEARAQIRGEVWQMGFEKRRIRDEADFRGQLEAIAASTPRSAAGSSTVIPPATFTNTSSPARFKPTRFSSTASSKVNR